MTLEDFFTLTEMKDGLTEPSRVHELIAVMQKEKECITKNVRDATRLWAAVASTIAATENRDCLDLFIRLDGLSFIDKWLTDAKKHGNDAAHGFVEESLAAMLRALEKLQIDRERSVSSGIWITVNNLLDHRNSLVQVRARALFDSWQQNTASGAVFHDDMEASHDVSENGKGAESAAVDVYLTKNITNVEINVAEPARDENLQSRSSNCPQFGKVKEQPDSRNTEHLSESLVNTSALSNPICESLPSKENGLTSVAEGNSLTETHSFSKSEGPNTESELESPKKLSCFSDNSDMIASSGKVEPGVSSSVANTPNAKDNITEPSMQSNVEAEDNFGSNSLSGDAGKPLSPLKSREVDRGGNNDRSAPSLNSSSKDDCSPDSSPGSFLSNKKLEKPEDISTHFSHLLDIEVDEDDDDEENSIDGANILRDRCDFIKSTETLSLDWNNSRSDIGLEYGMIDALEVARQVALEVEREVVDYREQSSSSSSDKNMESDIREPDSPDSINTKQDVHGEVPNVDMPSEQHEAAEAFPAKDTHLINSNNLETETENGTHELESSQVTEVAPEQEIKTEKGPCDFDLNNFDLNEEVCSDDMESAFHPISTPISVVSASRPAVASGSPLAPLQFEGILGWKGSAATSAFRPASPRKVSNCGTIFETGGTINTSEKQRKDNRDFDLNVAEDGDEKILDLVPGRPMPVSSGMQSAESSLEVGPRRSEKTNLDLNQISNEGYVHQTAMRMEGQRFFLPNGRGSPSPASSSSSMQLSLRNFDLNDRPLFNNDSSGQGLYGCNQNAIPLGLSRPGDPVISILGTRVELGNREIGRKDLFLHHPSSLANGNPQDSIMDASVARTGGFLGIPTLPYVHSPVFGYNGMMTAPNMSMSPTMYGAGVPFPYMMDTAVASMVPQMLSSASAPPCSQPSFIMNMAGAPTSLNGAGPSQPSLDLNSGFANGGNAGGLRQFFMPGHTPTFEEHSRTNVKPFPSSGVGVKRRGPDGGWEPYPVTYKHPQPPWR